MITATKIYDKVQEVYFTHRKIYGDSEEWNHSYGKDIGPDSAQMRSHFSIVAKSNNSTINIGMGHTTNFYNSGRTSEYFVSIVGNNGYFSLSEDGALKGDLTDVLNLVQVQGALMTVTGEYIPVLLNLFGW